MKDGLRQAFSSPGLGFVLPGYPLSAMTTTLNLVSEMERIATLLSADQGGSVNVSLTTIAEKIARSIGIKTDEVAILAISNRWRHLHFLVPEALKNVGFIPLSSNSALAARTARESRPEIDNNFAAARHATIFESVKTSASEAGTIQKMISAPILLDGKVIGVLQISRKGATPHAAGPDFSAQASATYWRSANRSAKCFITSRLNNFFLLRCRP